MSLLDPISHALAAVLAATHDALTSLGAPPDAAATWVLGIAALVVLVRLAVLPLVVHGVRQAHAAARARPHLQGIAERYRGRTDAESVRALMRERRTVSAEHGVSRLGCLPVLLQLPVWIALYHLVADVASGAAVGAMGPGLVSSFGAASVVGVSLAGRGYLGGGGVHLAVVAGLALTAAVLSYVTQRFVVAPNTPLEGMPEAMVAAQRIIPVMSAGGMLVAGGVVPVALLVYWVCSSTWTLGQSAVVARWFPTPGTVAAARRA
ncbi:membrane protein insertase YidC [Nocardioides sp. zg-1228]|uniref:membrane protein insertase YidC n=1 Tax=Nocardioides sp. zg-1228 TaxID=2763008 RepID=UPI00164349EC|nr:membrane protein insertase YidC [Nocardioides sp. zg-1228]MBC2933765.1 membrane protein insertase YidC [Nocardioides sp. zg-1228]QSF58540.1 membrane protein insertase YidC [Nocardioides sp. zg-1228]